MPNNEVEDVMQNPYILVQNILTSVDDGNTIMNGKTISDENFTSIELYGSSVHKKKENDNNSSFHLENESGVGDITLYQVFPGIELVYNDMHMEYCNKKQVTASDVMEINYCKEGRSECLFGENQYCYMASGDLSFCSLHCNKHQSQFPTSHYHGVTVVIDFSRITDEMKNVLKLLSVNLERIKEVACMQEFTVIRANQTIEHIFSELYTVPDHIRQGYIRVKVLELLLVLTEIDPSKNMSRKSHFSGDQIDAIKQIHAFLLEHFTEHYTIKWLAEKFELSPTIMKKCFKGVYGDSIYSYMKMYRLQVAERLLRESKLTVGEIATQIGYLNPNKFTSAFTDKYGITPTAYRRKK